MKQSFFIVLLLCFGVGIESHAQRAGLKPARITKLSQPGLAKQGGGLDRIIGICGCEDCNGPLEHNNPVEDDPNGFFLGSRWSATALSGSGLFQGAPTMLTWSIVPDGTDANGGAGFVPSDLIASFDNLFDEPMAGTPDLTNRTWFSLLQQSFDRWGELAGVEYIYEPNDDGSINFGVGGVLGVRGDIRIGGFPVDGGGGVLAFNAFPNNGDMALDTTDEFFFGAPEVNFLFFRNIVTHEAGHGLGIFHLVSNDAGFLMEPALTGTFDGPQLDDIRAVQRHYGDVLEKSNDFEGNNTIENATFLGSVNIGDSISMGLDGTSGTEVDATEVDFLSVDDNGDIDFFEFTVTELGAVTITLTPVGTTYNQSAEGGPGATPLDPSAQSDLTLALFDEASAPLALVNENGLGDAEVIAELPLEPGNYFARITGAANTIQLYTIEVELEEFEPPNSTPPSDFTIVSGSVSGGDLSDLAGSDDSFFELVPAQTIDPSGPEIGVLLSTISPNLNPETISVTLESFANTSNVVRSVSIFNNVIGSFEELDLSDVSLSEQTLTFLPSDPANFYVGGATGLVLLKVDYEVAGPTLQFPWAIRIDQITINTD